MPTEDELVNARSRIDAEIRYLEERIRALWSQRNHFIPISRIPPEVMSEIFSLVQADYGSLYPYLGHFSSGNFLRWMQIMHVCRHWRTLALGQRNLWRIVPLDRPEYALLAFDRSGSIPIDILDEELGINGVFFDLIKANAYRLRGLQLTLPLEIINGEDEPLEPEDAIFYQMLTKEMIPASLKHLSLGGCSFNWDWLRGATLHTLEIANPPDRVGVDVFLDVLEAMPGLECLTLRRVFMPPRVPGEPYLQPSSSRKLSTLQVFIVEDDPHPSLQLFNLVKLRPNLEFASHVLSTSEEADNYTAPLFFRILQRHLNHTTLGWQTMSLLWQVDDDFIGTVDIRTTNCAQILFRYPETLNGNDRPFARAHMLNLFRGLPLHRLVEFSTNAISHPAWWSTFSALPLLRTVKVLTNAESLFEALVSHHQAYGDVRGGYIPAIFTALEYLEVHGMRFGKELKAKVPKALRWRWNLLGMKLQWLRFVNCSVPKDGVRQLSGAVGRVTTEGEMKKSRRT